MTYFDPVIDEEGREVECSIHLCHYTATFDDFFDDPLCPDHLEEAYQEEKAERQLERRLEELGLE